MSFRNQSHRFACFYRVWRKIDAKKRTQIGIANKPNKTDNQKENQQLEKFAHKKCPFVFCLLYPFYIWPFAQDHVIQIQMSGIEQTQADAGKSPPQYVLKKTVALVGMMGAGKTAVGRAVAAKLAVPFLDSDAEIEVAANLSVPEIFARDGEAFFRKRETEVISRLLDDERGILSTGGGAFLAQVNRDSIAARGVSLWLNADLNLLWNRVRHKDTRPLLRTKDPRATLEALYLARVPFYENADLSVVCAPKLTIDAMAGRVIETLLTRPDVLEKLHA